MCVFLHWGPKMWYVKFSVHLSPLAECENYQDAKRFKWRPLEFVTNKVPITGHGCLWRAVNGREPLCIARGSGKTQHFSEHRGAVHFSAGIALRCMKASKFCIPCSGWKVIWNKQHLVSTLELQHECEQWNPMTVEIQLGKVSNPPIASQGP